MIVWTARAVTTGRRRRALGTAAIYPVSCRASAHHVAGRRVLPVALAEPVAGHRRGTGLRAPAGVLRLQELERDGDAREDV